MAHFLVPAARMWDDVVHTCAHQRLFCSEDCVGDWLAATGSARGYVMDLGTLWRLAAHWYDGRLERGYVRREPSQAAAVFPREIAPPIRRFAEQSDTVVHWTEFDRGGHFAAMEVPDLLTGDVREFFRPLRLRQGSSGGRPG